MGTIAAVVAKNIRVLLKEKFPAIKFSIISKSYSGGNSIRINYIDGVSPKVIESEVNKFQAGNFNGMEDLYEYSKNPEGIERVKYIFVSRSLSQSVEKQALDYIKKTYSIEGKNYNDIELAVRRLTAEMDLSKGFDKIYAGEYSYSIF